MIQSTRLPMHDFVALDVETSSRVPTWVCSIGACRIMATTETATFYSLVASPRPIRFTHIHGLRAEDLRDAPPWRIVWQRFVTFMGPTVELVAFRAVFERKALLTMCALNGLRMPRWRFHCAAEAARQHFGQGMSLRSALSALGQPFPGRPHHALADARAAASLLLACRGQSAIRFS